MERWRLAADCGEIGERESTRCTHTHKHKDETILRGGRPGTAPTICSLIRDDGQKLHYTSDHTPSCIQHSP